MNAKPYADNVRVCEEALRLHGDTARGVGWKPEEAALRHPVMLGLLRPSRDPVTLLDFGCGASHLRDYMLRNGFDHVVYSGLDVSRDFLALSRRKHPSTTYYELDILDLDPASPPLPTFDYAVMNGVFTYRGRVTHEAMFAYLREIVRRLSERVRVGLAFNVITPHVDWERDDLFHLPMDVLLAFLAREISRHVVVRHDYALYEYTVYVYMDPTGTPAEGVKRRVDGRRPPA